jgi:predicted AAA+ superfamily ATPase
MFNRQSYLDKLIQAKDSDFVKVLTGVRRCGKSTLLMLYKDWLLERESKKIKLSKSVMRRWKMNL